MDDVETEQRISWKRRKLTTREGVILGVATVAGVGIITTLVSLLYRRKPKKSVDDDMQSLEAVVSGDAATPKFANLEEDDAHDTESSTRKTDATPSTQFNGAANSVTQSSENIGNADATEAAAGSIEELPTEDVERLPAAEAHVQPGSANAGNPDHLEQGSAHVPKFDQVEDAKDLASGDASVSRAS